MVLPFDPDDFLRARVRPAGRTWEGRFTTVIARASSVTLVTKERFLGDEMLYRFANRMLIGVSRLRARQLSAASTLVALGGGRARRPRAEPRTSSNCGRKPAR